MRHPEWWTRRDAALTWIVVQLSDVYTEREALRWAQSRHDSLGGRPIDLTLESREGLAEVGAEIDRLRSGAYA